MIGFLSWAAAGITLVVFLLLAFTDLRSRTLPNSLLVVIVLSFVLVQTITPQGFRLLIAHLLTGAALLLLFAVFYAKQGVAGGDVKLAGAVGLWAGPLSLVVTLLVIAGALLILIVAHRAWLRSNPGKVKVQENPTMAHLPMGIALAAGGLWAVIAWSIRSL